MAINYYQALKEESTIADSLMINLLNCKAPPGASGCAWINYLLFNFGCITIFGEFPPLCILCQWGCYCENCWGISHDKICSFYINNNNNNNKNN